MLCIFTQQHFWNFRNHAKQGIKTNKQNNPWYKDLTFKFMSIWKFSNAKSSNRSMVNGGNTYKHSETKLKYSTNSFSKWFIEIIVWYNINTVMWYLKYICIIHNLWLLFTLFKCSFRKGRGILEANVNKNTSHKK